MVVPAGTDVVKCFIWNADKQNAPLVSSVVRPEYIPDDIVNFTGVKQTNVGEITAVGTGFEANSEIAVSVSVRGGDFGEDVIYADQITADENGKGGICFRLNEAASDEYTVSMTDAEGAKKELNISYVNDDEYIDVVEKLDEAVLNNTDEIVAVTEIKDILDVEYKKTGISPELYGKVDAIQAAELLYAEIKENGMCADRVAGTMLVKKVFIVAAVANGKIDNLFDCEDELQLEDDKNYQWYSRDYVLENTKKAITLRQKGSYSTLTQFFEKMEESFILSVVQYPDGVGNLREVLQDSVFAEKIGISAKAKDSVYRALSGENFDSLGELKSKFEVLEEKALESDKNKNNSGGGGFSGGKTQNMTFGDNVNKETLPTTIALEIFEDIDGYEWAKQAIICLAEQKIVSGKEKTKFFPGDMVTREEMAAMLVRAFVKDAESADISFSDTQEDAWYSDYLEKAVGAGIVQGYDDGRFGVGEYITRQDMVVMITRTMDYAGLSIDAKADGNLFTDDDSIADYAKDAVYKLKYAGIVNGVTVDAFAPNDNANRAQAAKIIFALLNI